MRFSILSVIAAATSGLLSLLPFASANVESFGVPQVVRIGEPFEAILTKADTLSSILDVAVAWGVQDAANAHGSNEIVGYPIGSTYLGPDVSKSLANFTTNVTIPSGVFDNSGKVILGAGLYELLGVSGAPTLDISNVTVTLGNQTSSEYVWASL